MATIATDKSTRFMNEMNKPKKAKTANLYRSLQQDIWLLPDTVLRSLSISITDCNPLLHQDCSDFLTTKTSATDTFHLLSSALNEVCCQPHNLIYKSALFAVSD